MEQDQENGGRRQRNGVLELGAMAWAVRTRQVHLPKPDSDLLSCSWDIRNALAHLCPLTDEELDRLAAVMLPKRVGTRDSSGAALQTELRHLVLAESAVFGGAGVR